MRGHLRTFCDCLCAERCLKKEEGGDGRGCRVKDPGSEGMETWHGDGGSLLAAAGNAL